MILNTLRGRMRGTTPKDGPLQRAFRTDPIAPNPVAPAVIPKNPIKPGLFGKLATKVPKKFGGGVPPEVAQ